MKDRIEGAKVVGLFRLDKHDLRFHKVSNKDGSGKCDAFFTDDEDNYILGVLYEIASNDVNTLDRYEGFGYGYSKKNITVYSGATVERAFTYYATITDERLKPYSWYLRHVIEGAKLANFPESYIACLHEVSCDEDMDRDRVEKELAIYDK